MIIVGTTDTDFNTDPKNVKVEKEDVTYLLKIVNDYFPGGQLTEADIVSSYAGVRPLVHDGSENESKTSREHTIFADDLGIVFVAGGKYTTYRKMSEDVIEKVLNNFSTEHRVRFNNVNTAIPLNKYYEVEAYENAVQIVKLGQVKS
jgi:glycerol-3-phosphate dehydrogenase